MARRGRFAADASAVTVGLKFFNVYGANEYHKGSQQSTVAHFYRQIAASGTARLFKSYRPDIADGEQLRDFVAVTDCVNRIIMIIDRGGLSGSWQPWHRAGAEFQRPGAGGFCRDESAAADRLY